MKHIILAAGIAFASLATAAPAAEITGRWATPRDGVVLDITRCAGQSLCGKLVSSDALRANPGAKDSKNRSKGLRTRDLKGVPVLWGFKAAGGQWTGGQIYNVSDGKTYKGTIEQTSEDFLNVKGCMSSMIGVNFCGIQQWKRIK